MISVIICTYNRARYISAVLESVAGCGYEDYEIVVVDNNSADNTPALVREFAENHPQLKLRYCLEPVQGLSSARNRGISEAEGDILVFVDDDATVGEGYLSAYAELFERRPEIYAAGGPIIPSYECGVEPKWMTYHLKRLLTGYLYFGDREIEFPAKNYPGGGNAAYRREVFQQVGLYNTELGRNGGNLGGGEEKDIFRKMEAAGLKYAYTPGSILYHSIPDHKLEDDYFRLLTLGIGESERKRTLAISRAAYLKRVLAEMVKWAGTLVLALKYLILFRPQSAGKLIEFRANVSRKLFSE